MLPFDSLDDELDTNDVSALFMGMPVVPFNPKAANNVKFIPLYLLIHWLLPTSANSLNAKKINLLRLAKEQIRLGHLQTKSSYWLSIPPEFDRNPISIATKRGEVTRCAPIRTLAPDPSNILIDIDEFRKWFLGLKLDDLSLPNGFGSPASPRKPLPIKPDKISTGVTPTVTGHQLDSGVMTKVFFGHIKQRNGKIADKENLKRIFSKSNDHVTFHLEAKLFNGAPSKPDRRSYPAEWDPILFAESALRQGLATKGDLDKLFNENTTLANWKKPWHARKGAPTPRSGF